jgi:hypothetical protein
LCGDDGGAARDQQLELRDEFDTSNAIDAPLHDAGATFVMNKDEVALTRCAMSCALDHERTVGQAATAFFQNLRR